MEKAFCAESAILRIKVDSEDAMKELEWALGVKLPSNIKQIIISALDAEIAKLDEE